MTPGREPSFSIYEFKYWLEKQPDAGLQPTNLAKVYAQKTTGDATGCKVGSRLGIQRLENEIAKHNIDLKKTTAINLAKCFKDNDGVIVEMLEDLKVVVETKTGKFALPKGYTKPVKN